MKRDDVLEKEKEIGHEEETTRIYGTFAMMIAFSSMSDLKKMSSKETAEELMKHCTKNELALAVHDFAVVTLAMSDLLIEMPEPILALLVAHKKSVRALTMMLKMANEAAELREPEKIFEFILERTKEVPKEELQYND
jgi:hypothetical protein